MTNTMILGDVEITRLLEWSGPFATVDTLFPSIPGELWDRHESWLAPEFVDAATREWQANVQTWVLRSAGRTLLVDTGLGNRKTREVPVFNDRRGDFIDRLAAVGVRPEDVDIVVNTHLHNDHVGWSTTLVDGEWVPNRERRRQPGRRGARHGSGEPVRHAGRGAAGGLLGERRVHLHDRRGPADRRRAHGPLAWRSTGGSRWSPAVRQGSARPRLGCSRPPVRGWSSWIGTPTVQDLDLLVVAEYSTHRAAGRALKSMIGVAATGGEATDVRSGGSPGGLHRRGYDVGAVLLELGQSGGPNPSSVRVVTSLLSRQLVAAGFDVGEWDDLAS